MSGTSLSTNDFAGDLCRSSCNGPCCGLHYCMRIAQRHIYLDWDGQQNAQDLSSWFD